ncbi:MAG TPA: class II aldolase/adducin family protein [Phycisphaerae bacterium]|nr:class II aldolase/adducin family protein [Phycisphaerae bacterium]HPS52656.1 class II aldolase/adducin family protein [Phycisphaerae bacterium]
MNKKFQKILRSAVAESLGRYEYSPSEDTLRVQMCDIGRRMYERGYVAANDGNLCCRLGNGRFLCTPTGVSKGFMKPHMLCIVDENGCQLEGEWPCTSEIKLHLAIMREVPHIHAVAHAHSPYASAFAVAGRPVPPALMPEVEALLGPVPTAPFALPGSKELAESVIPFVRNNANTVLLSNHGAVGCDVTLEAAYFHLETLDSYLRTVVLAEKIGTPKPISEQAVAGLLEWKRKNNVPDPRLPAGAVKTDIIPPAMKPAGESSVDALTQEILRRLSEKIEESPELLKIWQSVKD